MSWREEKKKKVRKTQDSNCARSCGRDKLMSHCCCCCCCLALVVVVFLSMLSYSCCYSCSCCCAQLGSASSQRICCPKGVKIQTVRAGPIPSLPLCLPAADSFYATAPLPFIALCHASFSSRSLCATVIKINWRLLRTVVVKLSA